MMGLKRKQVDGLTDFLSLVDILKQGGASRVFVLFCGSRDEETGESWCSDCVKGRSRGVTKRMRMNLTPGVWNE